MVLQQSSVGKQCLLEATVRRVACIVVIHRRERSFKSTVSANGDRVPYEQTVHRKLAWALVHVRAKTITHHQRTNYNKTDTMEVITAPD